MTRLALIGLFGAGGAMARLGVSNLVGERSWPWATLAINVAGSFALGLLVAWGASKLAPDVSSAVGIGFLGAFTTFSTFAVETHVLGDSGRVPAAVVYAVASVALGVLAAAGGVALGRELAR